MVPGTWLSGVIFAVLVAPGLLFDLLSEQRRARATESTFREISRVVLASIAFSGFSLAILAVVRTLVSSWLPDPRQLFFGEGNTYLADHYRFVLRALVAEIGIALSVAAGLHFILARKSGGAKIRSVNPWTTVFRRECPKGYEPIIRVRMSNGTIYVGRVGHFTPDLKLDDRELILTPPLWSKTPTVNALELVPGEWKRIVIRGADIEVLSVQYKPIP